MEDIQQSLENHLKKINTAPFLFVGSGFSRRYLNTENWGELMKKFSAHVPEDFDYYSSTANKDWAQVAELMAKDFHPIWWKNEKYKESREEFKGNIASDQSPLKIEIAKYLRDIRYEYGVNEKSDKEITALKKVVIDGIITTNWDTLLEQIFAEHQMQVYVGQKELLFSQPLEVNEIYKIHGCSSIPDSLVLSTRDYNQFNKRNAYLAAKLLTIFIEHPVIFIGYSVSDENILQILKSITDCLDQDNIDKLKDRLIFVERAGEEEDVFQSSSITIDGITIPLTRIKTNDYELVYEALARNKRRFSMRLMRQMKSQIYELVKTNDPDEKIYVVDGELEDPQDVEFVIGVGVKSMAEQIVASREALASTFSDVGYGSLPHIELFKEILVDVPCFDYNSIVQKTLPELLKIYHNLPVFRYVKQSDINVEQLDPKIIKRLNMRYDNLLTQRQRQRMKDLSWQWQFGSIKDVVEGYSELKLIIENIPLLGEEKIDCDELKEFLEQHKGLLEESGMEGAGIRRLFRIYDWLKYRNL